MSRSYGRLGSAEARRIYVECDRVYVGNPTRDEAVVRYLLYSTLLQLALAFAWFVTREPNPTPATLFILALGASTGGLLSGYAFWLLRAFAKRGLLADCLAWAIAGEAAIIPLMAAHGFARREQVPWFGTLLVAAGIGASWCLAYHYVNGDFDRPG